MKTLTARLLQIMDQLRSVLRSGRNANCSWLYPRPAEFELVPVIARTLNRHQDQRLRRQD